MSDSSMQAAGMSYLEDLAAMERAFKGTPMEGVQAPNGLGAAQVILARLASEENGRRLLIKMDDWNRLEEELEDLRGLVAAPFDREEEWCHWCMDGLPSHVATCDWLEWHNKWEKPRSQVND
jgi:hypothetical protein